MRLAGPEWNTLRTHANLVQPKIVTKPGVIIQPVQVPKKVKDILE